MTVLSVSGLSASISVGFGATLPSGPYTGFVAGSTDLIYVELIGLLPSKLQASRLPP